MIRATRNPFPLNRKFKTGPQLRTSALRNRCRTPHLPGPLVPPFLLDVVRGGLSVSRFSRKGSNTGMLQNWS